MLSPQSHNSGSVLILTVIISTVLFSIGIALTSILQKEVTRHLYADRSVVALNIANTALECALYNDFRRFVFSDDESLEQSAELSCGNLYHIRPKGDWGSLYTPNPEPGTNPAAGTGRYEYVVVQPDRGTAQEDLPHISDVPCAWVIVRKQCLNDDGLTPSFCADGLIESFVEVRGYASCSEDNEAERGLVRRFRLYY